MNLYNLHREQLIRRPREEVFAFFERPENLSRITPPRLGLVILTPAPIVMQKGTLIDYTVSILGIRRHWRTLITDYEPPRMFSDVQLKGPYTFWHHTHRFREAEGGTLIIDDVRYVMPLGLLGSAMHSLFVKRQLKRIFDYRAAVIDSCFRSEMT
jgi:ligand-binding SRPBCC domain-containing protein